MKHVLFSLYYLFIVGVWLIGALHTGGSGYLPQGQAVIVIAWMICVYWLPFMFACHRDTRNAMGVALINMLTGWTGIGWFVALAMAIVGRRN